MNSGAYYNRTTGSYYNNKTETSVDFTSTGLTDTAKSMLGDAKWYLGGVENYTSSSNGLVSHFYSYERGTTVYTGRSINWIGKVGLIYPSDYGYATSGGSSTNRTGCMAKEMYVWKHAFADSSETDCVNNDWLFKSSYMWTLSTKSSSPYFGFYIDGFGGNVVSTNSFAIYAVLPVVHLKSTIKITGGTGSSTDPFILG